MTNTKLSATMEEALVYLGRGSYRAHLEPETRTLMALERRGMIEWAEAAEVGTTYDTTILWNVTVAGWAFLWATYSIERPADAGRLTLEEALAEAGGTWLPEAGDGICGSCLTQQSDLNAHWSTGCEAVDAPVGLAAGQPLPIRVPGATDLDAGRLTLTGALAEAYTNLGVTQMATDPAQGCVTFIGSGPTSTGQVTMFATRTVVDGWLSRGLLHRHTPGQTPTWHTVCDCPPVMATDPEPPRRDGWLDQEAGSGPGAGPGLGDHRKMTSATNHLVQGASEFHKHLLEELDQAAYRIRSIRPTSPLPIPEHVLRMKPAEVEDSIVIPDIDALDVSLSRVVQEANRLTETRDAFARKAVYREHTPEDDMYVDRAAWKAEETRIAALREQLRVSTRQRNTFEARNGRAPMCGREMSTGRPCPQHTPEDTREQHTKRDTYGDPIAYRDVPVPADLAGHWYGVEAISWTRGVNASYVQAMRIAKGLGL